MRIDTAVVEILGCRIALAFPHPSYIGPGGGDLLIQRLQPFFPTIGIMLLTLEWGEERAYATFETDKLLAALDIDQIFLKEVNLDHPPEDDSDPPF